MAIYSMKKLLHHARKNKYAVGYFEAFNMDALLAVLTAAESKDSPVIIGFGGQFVGSPARDVKEDIYNYGAVAKMAAQRSGVPAAVLLNEADSEEMVFQGMHAGFNAVMYQKQGENFSDTVKITKEICRVAHYLGIDVESEVGELPMANITANTITKGSFTNTAQAEKFVQDTGIDALAVSIGNIHLLESKKSTINFDLLGELVRNIGIPLVLHGGTGVSDEDMKKAIEMGIAKVNVGTAMKRAYLIAIDNYRKEKDIENIDPHITIGWGGGQDMISCGRAAITEKVAEFIDLFGSAGKAGSIRGESL